MKILLITPWETEAKMGVVQSSFSKLFHSKYVIKDYSPKLQGWSL